MNIFLCGLLFCFVFKFVLLCRYFLSSDIPLFTFLTSHCPDWKPPAKGNRDAGIQLARLFGDATDAANIGNIVDKANDEAVNRLKSGTPFLLDIKLAKDVIPGTLCCPFRPYFFFFGFDEWIVCSSTFFV
jgi:hypothetical protein